MHCTKQFSFSSIEHIIKLLAPYRGSEIYWMIWKIVLGDFHVNWLSPASDHLKESSAKMNLSQMIPEPATPNLKDPSRPTLINLILINRVVQSLIQELWIWDSVTIVQ